MWSKIDLLQLRHEIRKMRWNTKLYKALKEELSILGHWKNKPRGNPKKAWAKSHPNEK